MMTVQPVGPAGFGEMADFNTGHAGDAAGVASECVGGAFMGPDYGGPVSVRSYSQGPAAIHWAFSMRWRGKRPLTCLPEKRTLSPPERRRLAASCTRTPWSWAAAC